MFIIVNKCIVNPRIQYSSAWLCPAHPAKDQFRGPKDAEVRRAGCSGCQSGTARPIHLTSFLGLVNLTKAAVLH